MYDMQQNRINEPHINAMHREELTDYMATCKGPMATLEHLLA
jgi:hypothetical protein